MARKCEQSCGTFIETQRTIGDDESSANFEGFGVVRTDLSKPVGPMTADDINWSPDRRQRVLAGAAMRDMLDHCGGPNGPSCGTYDVPLTEGLPDVLVVILPDGWTPPDSSES